MSTKVETQFAAARRQKGAARHRRRRARAQEYGGLFTVDGVRCALTLRAGGISWVPLSLARSVAAGETTATTNGCRAEHFAGTTTVAWADVVLAEARADRGIALHCLCVDERAPQQPRLYVVHTLVFVGEVSGTAMPRFSPDMILSNLGIIHKDEKNKEEKKEKDDEGQEEQDQEKEKEKEKQEQEQQELERQRLEQLEEKEKDPLWKQEQAWLAAMRKAVHAAHGDPAERAPVLVLVNPFSGTRRGEAIWREACQPLCDAAGLRTEVVVTTHAGHARAVAHALDLARYSAVATVGGDGILNEVLNGLLTRADWREAAAALPVAPIAGGTGNACGHTLYNSADPRCGVAHVLRGATRPLDVFLCVQPRTRDFIWGVLNFSNGIIAEADFGSETIRWAGSLRPNIWAVYRIMMGSFYNWRITYLPTTVPTRDWRGVRCTRNCKYCENALRHRAEVDIHGDDGHSDESHHHEEKEEEKHEQHEQHDHEDDHEEHHEDDHKDGTLKMVEMGEVVEEDEPRAVEKELPPSGPAYTHNMSTVDAWVDGVPAMYRSLFADYAHHEIGQPLPAGWETKDNLALSFSCFQKLPWLMPGMQATPYSHLADGCMDVAFATSDAFSRVRFITLFASLGSGQHAEHPKLTYLKVRSFTVEPLDSSGYIGVDGERMPFGPAQFHVAQGLMNFFCYM